MEWDKGFGDNICHGFCLPEEKCKSCMVSKVRIYTYRSLGSLKKLLIDSFQKENLESFSEYTMLIKTSE